MIRFFHHYVPLSMLLLMAVEFCLFFFVSTFSAEHYGSMDSFGEAIRHSADYRPWVFATLTTLVLSLFGLYDWEWTQGRNYLLTRVLGGFVLCLVLVSAGAAAMPGFFAQDWELAAVISLSLLGVMLIRLIYLQWGNVETFKKRVLVLGTGSRAAKIEEIANSGQALGMQIVGYLPMGGAHHYVPRGRILEESGNLWDIVDRYGIEEIVVAVRERRSGGLPVAELLECKLRGTHILDLTAFFERQTGILPLESINASWMIFAEGFRRGTLRDIDKRAFDLVASTILLLTALPVMLLTALAIKLETKGSVFYSQERVGQSGKPFVIFKFRSMCNDAERDGTPRWAQADDDRTTRVGRFIRRTRIDELPQLINVFLGQMSFVGPRPERPYFVQELSAHIPYYNTRHSVKPGITGWAQVRFHYGGSIEDTLNKLQYDLYYVKNHSLFLDLMILLQTVQVVVLGKGAR